MLIIAPKVDHDIKIHEFELKVPWGVIACKWWGSQNIRPVLCVHGWQDNAGSFDRLIPYLPTHLSYLVIELPGHGLSSPIPNGFIYTHITFLYVLLLVIKKYQWKKVSLLAHSMGAMVCYMFASSFPDRCDMMVCLDITKPDSLTKNFERKFLLSGINEWYVADARNQQNTEPPSYSYDELIEKLTTSKMFPMNIESASYLLYRGVRPSKLDPKKYYFSRDNRLKPFTIFIPVNKYEDMAKRIASPFCFIKARQSYFQERGFTKIYEIMSENPNFELHRIDGRHHIHLDDPKRVGGIISNFICKYRPVPGKL